MDGLNRFVILILLLGVLYALYIYQQKILACPDGQTQVKRIEQEPEDTVSQYSLGSLVDVRSIPEDSSNESFLM